MKLRKNRKSFIFISLITISLFTTQTLAKEQEQKWEAFLDIEGKAGTKRHIGEADIFIPLWQDKDTLFYTDVRYRLDNQSSREGNFGLGIRYILPSDWIIGGYGYYDRRKSSYENMFKQINLGVEALSVNWDFRANAYIPRGKTSYLEESLSSVDFSGSSIMYSQGEERSLKGYDAEIGYRVPIFNENDGQQIRLYAGGYKFYNDGVETVKGPRGRFELTFDEVPFLWEGSRLTLGAETQKDDVRGRQSFASFRLRIPFSTSKIKKKAKLNAIEKRMTTPIVRDVDIVSQSGVFETPKAITTDANGGKLVYIKQEDISSGAELNTLIQNAGDNATIVLNGAFNNIDALLSIKSGQTIIGSGNLSVNLPSGRPVFLSLPGASISGEGGAQSLLFGKALFEIVNSDNSKVMGLNINHEVVSNHSAVFVVRFSEGVEISNNTIMGSSTNDVSVSTFNIPSFGTNVTINNNIIKMNFSNTTGRTSFFESTQPGRSTVSYSNNTSTMTSSAPSQYFIFSTVGGMLISGSNNSSNVTNGRSVESIYTLPDFL